MVFDNKSQHSDVEKKRRERTTISYTSKKKEHECHQSKIFKDIFCVFKQQTNKHIHAAFNVTVRLNADGDD